MNWLSLDYIEPSQGILQYKSQQSTMKSWDKLELECMFNKCDLRRLLKLCQSYELEGSPKQMVQQHRILKWLIGLPVVP